MRWDLVLFSVGMALLLIGLAMLALEYHEIPVFGARLGLWGFVPELIGGGMLFFSVRKSEQKPGAEKLGSNFWLYAVVVGSMLAAALLHH